MTNYADNDHRPTIGVMGCLPELPNTFPLETPENSGNTIHGQAPFEMFGNNAIFYKDQRFNRYDLGLFADYVNSNCSHLIVTLANFIKIGDDSGDKYARFHGFLKTIAVPIVIFGLGAQSKTQELEGELPREAIDLLKYLGDSTEVVGVRGEYTAAVFEHFAGVKNTFVTGCPSFFSRPASFAELRNRLNGPIDADNASYNGTTYHDAKEKQLLISAIKADHYLIEPVNRFTARFSQELIQGVEEPEIPWFLKGPVKNGLLTREELENYFQHNFHLFRKPAPWYTFNRDHVSFTYGTRFHVNMASLLSGVPALWVTHDSRTQELTDFLKVPRIAKDDALALGVDELTSSLDYKEMFEALPGLFRNFNEYLAIHDLPAVATPDV